MSDNFENRRVDVFVDNQAVSSSWESGGGKSSDLNLVFKEIFFKSVKQATLICI